MTNRELIKETFAGDPDRLRLFIQLSEGLFASEEARRECEEVLAELEEEARLSKIEH